jgi:hypothetical protein
MGKNMIKCFLFELDIIFNDMHDSKGGVVYGRKV